MKASTITSKAREPLADTAKERWTDGRLLSLLNDCLLDLAFNTDIWDAIGWVKLIPGQAVYNMSDLVARFNRIEYNGQRLRFTTYAEMDSVQWNDLNRDGQEDDRIIPNNRRYVGEAEYTSARDNYNWQKTKGVPTAVVYDLRRAGQMRLYPVPDGNLVIEGQYGIALNINDDDGKVDIIGEYGILNEEPHLKLFYTKLPDTIGELDDEVDIDRTMISMVVDYLVSFCYADNQDESSRALSTRYLRSYEIKKAEFQSRNAEDGIAGLTRTTEYRPIG